MGLGRSEVHRAKFVRTPWSPARDRVAWRLVGGQWNGFSLLPHPFQPACSAGFAETAGHAGRQPVDDTHRSEKRVSAGVAFCLDKELPFSQDVWLPTMCVSVCETRTSSPRHEKCNTNRKARSFCVLHRTVIELTDIEMRWQVRRGCFHVCLRWMGCERMRTLSNRNLWCIVQSICKTRTFRG